MVAERGGGREWVRCVVGPLLVAMAVNVLMPLLIPLGEQITNGKYLIVAHQKYCVHYSDSISFFT